MNCATVMIVINLALANMSHAEGKTVCVPQQAKLVNFLQYNKRYKAQLKRSKLMFDRRRSIIKGTG